jgi:hypothetical protein
MSVHREFVAKVRQRPIPDEAEPEISRFDIVSAKIG